MTDWHIIIYAALAFIVISIVALFYKEFQLLIFDREYGKSLGVKMRLVDSMAFMLAVTAVVIGIRSVGVVLMSAMLIAPAAAARQFTHKLWLIFILAADRNCERLSGKLPFKRIDLFTSRSVSL